MGQITERLPAPQYDTDTKSLKRNNSLPNTSNTSLLDGKKMQDSPREEISIHSSPGSQGQKSRGGGLQNLANRAQRNMDLPVIEENVAGNEEEETLRTNKGLYRPPHRSSLSRDSSIQRKNRGIIQNAGIAAPLRAGNGGLSNLPPNYKAGNYHSSNVVTNAHSAQVKSNPKLCRDLKAEP